MTNERGWYRVPCRCTNCGWIGRAVIRHGLAVAQVKCPLCEVPSALTKADGLWPWQSLKERTAFRA